MTQLTLPSTTSFQRKKEKGGERGGEGREGRERGGGGGGGGLRFIRSHGTFTSRLTFLSTPPLLAHPQPHLLATLRLKQ